jgi:hypothetical protein
VSGAAGTTGTGAGPGGAGTTGAGTAGTTGSAGTGTTGTAGTTGAAGTTGTAGAAGRGGTTGSAGTTGVAGTTGSAGRGGTTGTAGTTGAAGRGGTTGTAGVTGTAGTGTDVYCVEKMDGKNPNPVPVAATVSCPNAPATNANPFGCTFGWGRQSPSGSLTGYTYLAHVADWIESGIKADGTFSTCSGCNWLKNQVTGTNLIPVYYAYMIGFYGHMNGLPDGNQSSGPNLTTGGAALIKANRAKIIQMYTSYAQQTYAVWKTKPLVWLLEGDFIQYADDTTQGSALTCTELGQLAADITCAIKGAMPNAVVAIDHSSWNSNRATLNYWNAMHAASYDLVWTTGVGDNPPYLADGTNASTYNAASATYAYLHQLTGKNIFVDTSYGASAMNDSWSNQTASVLNMQIGNGVIGINVSNNPPSNYQTLITALEPMLSSTCH